MKQAISEIALLVNDKTAIIFIDEKQDLKRG
ncbi:hypothetical protein AX25_02275 [Listeria ivanovii WSLC3009]|nr:hypothetical protein AX25_02275 [Listeria ivanovii WSLC3009]